jgi:hypothetical protein
MDTIKIYNLEKIKNNSRGRRLASDMSIYIRKDSKGLLKTRSLSFSNNLEAIKNGFLRINFAENSLTGDVYIVFSKTKGIELKRKNDGDSLKTQANNVVDLLAALLNLNKDNGLNMPLKLSENLSKTDDCYTYKVLVL